MRPEVAAALSRWMSFQRVSPGWAKRPSSSTTVRYASYSVSRYSIRPLRCVRACLVRRGRPCGRSTPRTYRYSRTEWMPAASGLSSSANSVRHRTRSRRAEGLPQLVLGGQALPDGPRQPADRIVEISGRLPQVEDGLLQPGARRVPGRMDRGSRSDREMQPYSRPACERAGHPARQRESANSGRQRVPRARPQSDGSASRQVRHTGRPPTAGRGGPVRQKRWRRRPDTSAASCRA